METPVDSREATLLTIARTAYAQQVTAFLQSGYPHWLATSRAQSLIRQTIGIDLALSVGHVPLPEDEDELVYDVRALSVRYGLEHDGSALHALLERYDYQWRLSNGTWHPTERTQQEALGFLLPGPRRLPQMLWKPRACRQVITLEQARQALEPPGEPNLLRRYSFTPRELGARWGLTTREIHKRLALAGYQERTPHGRTARWEPTRQARQARCYILGDRTLEWWPQVVEALL